VDPFAPFLAYVTARLIEDPHLWAITLFDELLALGFTASYPTLTREIRGRRLRPICPACVGVTGRPNAIIEHLPGAETQWDWLELPDPPASWGWGKSAHLLVGSLAHSGRWRAVLSPSMDQPHLIDALDRITRGLGGLTQTWRFDRMATVCHPDTGRVSASFAGVAKHYAVTVSICPPRSGHRKGVVEKINHTAAQRWWRTLADELSVEAAQASVDTFARTRGDTRLRPGSVEGAGGKLSVATVAAGEPLRPAPTTPYPVIIAEARTVSRQSLVAYRGNRYSVPPELAGAQVAISRPIGGECVDIATSAGIVVARHRLAADGAGAVIRDHGHVVALDHAAMATASSARPHRRKERIPPGAQALAAANALRHNGSSPTGSDATVTAAGTDVIDLATYERAAHGRNTLA
jgi:transposase